MIKAIACNVGCRINDAMGGERCVERWSGGMAAVVVTSLPENGTNDRMRANLSAEPTRAAPATDRRQLLLRRALPGLD